MKHEIEIEGLPEGWEPVAFRMPIKGVDYVFENGRVFLCGYDAAFTRLIVKKKQPRRIVLEETGDIRLVRPGEHYGYVEDNIYIGMWPAPNNSIYRYRIWREVKETAQSLNNADSLRLSVEECKTILTNSSELRTKINKFVKDK